MLLNDAQTGWTLAELGQLLNIEWHGESDIRVRGIGTLQSANAEQLSFLANPGYRQYLQTTEAGIVILSSQDAESYSGARLISDNPYLSYCQFAELFQAKQHEHRSEPPDIHPSAVIADDIELPDNLVVAAHSCIGSGVVLGQGVRIAAGVIIEPDCHIGANTHIKARAWIGAASQIGQRVIIHQGAVIGSDGFGLAWNQNQWRKVPQLGSVHIADDCEVGANTCIDRGSIGNTRLHQDVRLDNQIQIAHNVEIGAHTAIAACTGIAGSTTIGSHCLVGGGCGIGGHLTIADHVELTGMSMVTRSLTEAGRYGSAIPAEPERIWHRNIARLRRLDRYFKRQQIK